MNEKITLPALVNLLSAHTGDSKKLSEDFVKAFFTAISNALAAGDSVKVKNFGVFKCIDVESRKSVNVNNGAESVIPAHKKVVFIPTKDLASLVNTPFEMFDSVEIVEPAEEDEQPEVAKLAEEEAIVASDAEEELTALTAVEAISEAEEPDQSDEPDKSEEEEYLPIYNLRDSDIPQEPESEPESEPEPEPEPEPEEESPEPQQETPEPEEEPEPFKREEVQILDAGEQRKRHRFLFGFLTGVAASIVAIVIAWVVFIYIVDKDINPAPAPSPAPVAKVAEKAPAAQHEAAQPEAKPQTEVADNNAQVKEEVAPTAESDKRVYDTITKTRYLTTMAQDHYGNFNLWPYIYMENKDFLGHPDRIRPGTKVVIPDLAKYGVNPKNKSDISKAKKLGVEIYSRYQ